MKTLFLFFFVYVVASKLSNSYLPDICFYLCERSIGRHQSFDLPISIDGSYNDYLALIAHTESAGCISRIRGKYGDSNLSILSHNCTHSELVVVFQCYWNPIYCNKY